MASQRVHARARRFLKDSLEVERLVANHAAFGEAARARERAAAGAELTRVRFDPPYSRTATVDPAESAAERRRVGRERAAREVQRAFRQSAAGVAEQRARATEWLSSAVAEKRPPISERPWVASAAMLERKEEILQFHASGKRLFRERKAGQYAATFADADLQKVASETSARWTNICQQGAELNRAAHEREKALHAAAQDERELARGLTREQARFFADNVQRAREGQPRLRVEMRPGTGDRPKLVLFEKRARATASGRRLDLAGEPPTLTRRGPSMSASAPQLPALPRGAMRAAQPGRA
ncbi:hypothetical protein T492DRAFT_1044441 [Pavlovales sp. CCMP2436]|nr:hypothetical protein T492DRAFT_1044441 [Pavlovales sp. CCMP2436]